MLFGLHGFRVLSEPALADFIQRTQCFHAHQEILGPVDEQGVIAGQGNADRFFFVTRDMAVKVLSEEDAEAVKRSEVYKKAVTFHDEAFGLTPELIRHLGREYWWDPAAMGTIMDDPSFDVHDVVGGIQASAFGAELLPELAKAFGSMAASPTAAAKQWDQVKEAGWAAWQ